MENDEKDLSLWVEERFTGLEPAAEWRPDAAAALARLQARQRAGHATRRRTWLWVTAAAGALAAGIVLLLTLAPAACANPRGCAGGIWRSAHPKPAPSAAVAVPGRTEPFATPAVAPAATALPAKAASANRPSETAAPLRPATPALQQDFKESGKSTAPIVCEIYSDYECPHCAVFFQEILPLLVKQYVETGKVRLIHRDFPLPTHRYAMTAARYANAAGELGYYESAVDQIFRTQAAWSRDGDIERQLAPALPSGILDQVRQRMNDPNWDDTIATDLAVGHGDDVEQTPSLVIVWNGQRQVVAGNIAFSLLQSYLDQLLGRR